MSKRTKSCYGVAALVFVGMSSAVFGQHADVGQDASTEPAIFALPAEIPTETEEFLALFVEFDLGGDFLAAAVAEKLVASPSSITSLFLAMKEANDAQQRAVARAIYSAVQDIELVGTDQASTQAQLLTESVAIALLCADGGAPSTVDCAGISLPSEELAIAYAALESGEATASITLFSSLPGAIGLSFADRGALGTDADEIGRIPDALVETLREGFSTGNVSSFSRPPPDLAASPSEI